LDWWSGQDEREGVQEESLLQQDQPGKIIIPDITNESTPTRETGAPVVSDAESSKRSARASDAKGTKPAAGSAGAGVEAKRDEFTFYKTLGEKKTQGGVGDGLGRKEPERVIKKTGPALQGPPTKPTHTFSEKLYTIQIAAFREKERADALADRLKGKGYRAYVRVGQGEQGREWYRVRVGEYSRREEATRDAEGLRGKEGLQIFVTLTTN
jgi:cell division septation protein DedD